MCIYICISMNTITSMSIMCIMINNNIIIILIYFIIIRGPALEGARDGPEAALLVVI